MAILWLLMPRLCYVWLPLGSLLHCCCSLLTGSSVDHYTESACVSHATNAGLCPAERSWESQPGAVDEVGDI